VCRARPARPPPRYAAPMLPALLPLLLAPARAAPMSVDRLGELATRTPAAFDVFFAQKDQDLDARVPFRLKIDTVGTYDDLRAPVSLAGLDGGAVRAALPAGVFGGTVSVSGTTGDGARGWRWALDAAALGLSVDPEAFAAAGLADPGDSWSYVNSVGAGTFFDAARQLELTAGVAIRGAPRATPPAAGPPAFTTAPDGDGGQTATTVTTGAFLHAGWGPAGELAVTLLPDGLSQAVYRRPFEAARADGLGPLLGYLPALGQLRAGAYVDNLGLLPGRLGLDAEALLRREAPQGGDPAVGPDHATLGLELRLWGDRAPAEGAPDGAAGPSVALTARGSAWWLADGPVPGGAAELGLRGARLQATRLSVAVGGAWNEYRALSLLPLTDLPLVTGRIEVWR